MSNIKEPDYKEIAEKLWGLLDDISTTGDMAKSDDMLFRLMVLNLVEKRSQYFTSDGHDLFVVNKE